MEDMFISRIIALEKHIQQEALKNPILRKVIEHEQQNIIRLSMELKQELGIVTSGEVTSDMESPTQKKTPGNVERKTPVWLSTHQD